MGHPSPKGVTRGREGDFIGAHRPVHRAGRTDRRLRGRPHRNGWRRADDPGAGSALPCPAGRSGGERPCRLARDEAGWRRRPCRSRDGALEPGRVACHRVGAISVPRRCIHQVGRQRDTNSEHRRRHARRSVAPGRRRTRPEDVYGSPHRGSQRQRRTPREEAADFGDWGIHRLHRGDHLGRVGHAGHRPAAVPVSAPPRISDGGH